MNMTVVNNDLGSVIMKDETFRDELLTFAGAATVLEGTILARDSISKKLVPFVKGGLVNENGIPKLILTYPVTAIGAGDETVRAAVSGKFNKQRLVIDADGDDTNIDADVIDELRVYGLTPLDVTELNLLDNQ